MRRDAAPAGPNPTASERRWAVVRLILGQLQMMGAVVSFVLLLQTGINRLSLGAVVVTSLLTGLSLLLFRGR